MKKYIYAILALILFMGGTVYAANVFPTSLNNWSAGQTISSTWANALESTIGATNSATSSSLTYTINHLLATSSNAIFGTATTTILNVGVIQGSTTISQGLTNFTVSPIVPTPTTNFQAATKQYADNVGSQGAATATPTQAGISKLSVVAVDTNSPIVVGDNDPRMIGGTYNGTVYPPQESLATTSTTGVVATSTINVNASSTIFDVYFKSASTSDIVHLYFNGAQGYGPNQYAWNYLAQGTGLGQAGDATSTSFTPCTGGSKPYFHITIDNSVGEFKKAHWDGFCGATAGETTIIESSGAFIWLNTTPITSISFTTNNGINTVGQGIATSSIKVYQK